MFELWIDGVMVRWYDCVHYLPKTIANASWLCLTSGVWIHRTLDNVWLIKEGR